MQGGANFGIFRNKVQLLSYIFLFLLRQDGVLALAVFLFYLSLLIFSVSVSSCISFISLSFSLDLKAVVPSKIKILKIDISYSLQIYTNLLYLFSLKLISSWENLSFQVLCLRTVRKRLINDVNSDQLINQESEIEVNILSLAYI